MYEIIRYRHRAAFLAPCVGGDPFGRRVHRRALSFAGSFALSACLGAGAASATAQCASHQEKRPAVSPCGDAHPSFDAVCRILEEFGLDRDSSHLINGHIPVISGENPVKANGRYILIDGGFCKAYQTKTGIAGYTLIYSSRGLRLVSHGPFDGKIAALKENKDIIAAKDVVFEMMPTRKLVSDTDEGKEIIGRMEDLKMLLGAYLEGSVKQAGEH